MFGTLTRQVGTVAAARLATAAAGIGTNMLLAHLLSQSDAGRMQKGLFVAQLIVTGGAFGIQTSLYYFLPRVTPGQRRALAGQGVALLLGIACAAAAVVYPSAGWLAVRMNDTDLRPILQAAALSVLALLPAMAADPILIAQGRAGLAAVSAGAATAVQLIVVATVIGAGWPHEAVFFALVLAAIVRLATALIYAAFATRGHPWILTSRDLLREQAAYILPVGVVSLLDVLSTYLDRSLISIWYGNEDFAVYVYGAMEIPFISILMGSLMPVLLPRFSEMSLRDKTSAVLDLWHRATCKTAMVLFAVFFLFLWIAPSFLALLYSERYRSSALYFRIYLFLIPIRTVSFMPLLFALGRRNYVVTGSALDILLNFILSVALIRLTPLGMAGAAVGTVVATIAQAWFYLAGIRRALGVAWGQVLPWAALAREAMVVGGLSLVLWPLVVAGLPPSIEVLVAATLAMIYGFTRIIPRLRVHKEHAA
ncbi:MAG: oligosaccharide flippase family protein [Candidatus Sumerlaeaceae bacterium]|nr:oligosaccharide flippase family protein [Candidatus Sumerlaeaceae bacterium]